MHKRSGNGDAWDVTDRDRHAKAEPAGEAPMQLIPAASPQSFFSAVGSKPNESYEKLLDLLPTVKEAVSRGELHGGGQQVPVPGAAAASAPPGLGGATVSALRLTPAVHSSSDDAARSVIPGMHPMQKEWLDAADEVGAVHATARQMCGRCVKCV